MFTRSGNSTSKNSTISSASMNGGDEMQPTK